MPLPSPSSPHPSPAADPLAPIGRELQRLLASARRSLDDEIRAYPTPIPRCDAQFNHLYEQRARLAQLLQRVDAALEDGAASRRLAGALAEFAASPALGERADEARLRELVAAALAQP